MIDICTVVYRDEMRLLQLQANSVAQHCRDIGIRNIYVVLNDDETLVEKIDPAWWGDLAQFVLVVPRTAFSAPWVDNGWVSQQLYKMLAASMSYNTWTMVLDAKTVFVRKLELNQLVNSKGQLTTGQLPLYEVFAPAKKIVDDFFGIDLQRQAGPGGVPFFFHNDTVRMMIAECTQRSHESFPIWFQKQGRLTEFVLYSAFLQYKLGSLDQFFTDTCSLGNFINVAHNEVEQFDSKLQQMKNAQTLTVSVHRRAWIDMSETQRHAYRALLIDRGNLIAYDLE